MNIERCKVISDVIIPDLDLSFVPLTVVEACDCSNFRTPSEVGYNENLPVFSSLLEKTFSLPKRDFKT